MQSPSLSDQAQDTQTLHASKLVERIAAKNNLNYQDCLALINSGQMSLAEMVKLAQNGEGWLIASRLARFIEDLADKQDCPA